MYQAVFFIKFETFSHRKTKLPQDLFTRIAQMRLLTIPFQKQSSFINVPSVYIDTLEQPMLRRLLSGQANYKKAHPLKRVMFISLTTSILWKIAENQK